MGPGSSPLAGGRISIPGQSNHGTWRIEGLPREPSVLHRNPSMPNSVRWIFGLMIAGLVIIVPVVHFRWVYTHGKRLREVTPGQFYRSGQMTAAGFREAVGRYRIHTIVNLQDEYA